MTRMWNMNLEGELLVSKSYGYFLLFLWRNHIKVTLSTTECHRKEIADLTLVTLNSLRSDETFHLICDKAFKYANTL